VNTYSGKIAKVFTMNSEEVFMMEQNRCSRYARIGVHDVPEYAPSEIEVFLY
jgi:hypothetical protein